MERSFLNFVMSFSLVCFSLSTYATPTTLENILLSNHPGTLGSQSSLGITLTNAGTSGQPLCLYSMTFIPYSDPGCTTAQYSHLCIRSSGLDGLNSPCGVAYVQEPINVGGTLHWLPQSIYDMGSGLGGAYYDSSQTQCIQITDIQARSGNDCTNSGTDLTFSGTSSNILVSNCGASGTCTFDTSSVSIALTFPA